LSLAVRAPAKVNLTLHVLGRRPDGYHELESLVAFAGAGDTLALTPGPAVGLAVEGPFAAAAGDGDDNLVCRAARHLAERIPGLRTGAFRLTKRLPVAAGIGGGSSDAAAALRLLARLNALPLDHPAILEAARATGADVPVCLVPQARVMAGVGERLSPPLRLPRLFAVLVNPGAPLATAAVFAEFAREAGRREPRVGHPVFAPGLSSDQLLGSLAAARNDLEAPARRLAPVIGEALDALRRTAGCSLVRMSGSGATVFGLYQDRVAAAAAAKTVRDARPTWWVKASSLR
jgi:4-diphosphocytidyl-2-C-methyl-D-erythritol kinase